MNIYFVYEHVAKIKGFLNWRKIFLKKECIFELVMINKTKFIFIAIFMLIKLSAYSQSFLASLEKYKLDNASKISNSKTRKRIKKYIKSEMTELDTIFQSYKAKNNFDFNNADSLFFIYASPEESPATSTVLIWSGKDTISYQHDLETIKSPKPFKYKRTITYEKFQSDVERSIGYRVVTEMDSLITLVSKKDFSTINHLGDNQSINDGGYITVIVAHKENGKYKIESCSPPKFFIKDSYRKE